MKYNKENKKDLMKKIIASIKRNDDFIISLNNKAEVSNKDLLAVITTVNDNLQKYQYLNDLSNKGEIKCQ
jgi:hypothetical protein